MSGWLSCASNETTQQQQDVAEPLIQQEDKGGAAASAEDFHPGNRNPTGSLRVVWLSAATAVCGSFQYGICVSATQDLNNSPQKERTRNSLKMDFMVSNTNFRG